MVKRVRSSALSTVLKEIQAEDRQQEVTSAQSEIAATPQSSTTAIPQPTMKTRKTDTRDKVTFYLDPGQLDKLEELRMAYRKETGKRLNEQDFMRLIIDRLELRTLL